MPPPLSRAALQRATGVVGSLITLIALILLLRRGWALGDALGDQLLRLSPASFLAALAAYLLGGLLHAAGWGVLVRSASSTRPHLAPLFIGHLRSQLAKYLPGNIFHFAYRHVAARREGVGHRALGLALALESILLMAAAAALAFGVMGDPRIDTVVPWARPLVWLIPLLAAGTWAGIGLIGPRAGYAQLAFSQTGLPLALVLVAYVAFFVLGAASLRVLVDQPGALPFAAWCGWLSLAWIVGYVVPGAPAGLGLREAVLVLGLSPVLGDVDALALALTYRLITLLADGLLAIIGFAVPWYLARATESLPRDS